MTFRPDEYEKSVQVPIINDVLREEPEIFYGNLMFYYQSELLQQVQFAGLTASIEILYNDCKSKIYNYSNKRLHTLSQTLFYGLGPARVFTVSEVSVINSTELPYIILSN